MSLAITVDHVCGALAALARLPCLTDADKATRAVAEWRLHQALLSMGAPLPTAPARPVAARTGPERRRQGAAHA